MNEMSGKAQRFLSLDIARGLAALSVLLTHWGQWTFTYAGPVSKSIIGAFLGLLEFIWRGGGIHPGVVVFIVLSGFCIHLPQAKHPERLKQNGFWKSFTLRRAIRIMPVYWVALAIGVTSVLIMGTNNGSENHAISFKLLFSVTGTAEVARFFNESSEFFYPGNGPLSTVGVEMLLYASYPLFLFIHKKIGLTALLIIGLASYLSIAILRFQGVPPGFVHGTYLEFMLYWIIGAVCAEIFVHASHRRSSMRWVKAMVLFLTATYFVLINFVNIKGFHVATTLLFALAAGAWLILVLYIEGGNKNPMGRIYRLLSFAGDRSYSLYAVHTPIIFLSIYLLGSPNLLHEIYPWLILMITLFAAEAIYRFVEYPCHRYARTFRL